ncbi:MAG: hypothetical protein AAB403_09815 [Planctomycetota bacterium]
MLKPPRIGTIVDLPQLGDPAISFRQVVHIAQGINRTAGITLLAQLNLLLGVAAIKEDLNTDPNVRWQAQDLLLRTTISQRRVNQLRDKLRSAHLRDTVVFHRAQLLAAIRLVALFGDRTGGNLLETREDHEAIAELALGINGLLDARALTPASKALYQLAPQLAPSVELENLPRIDNALVRSRLMLSEHLANRADMPLASQLEQLFVFLSNGFSFEAFQSFMFGVFSYFQALPTDNLPRFQRDAFLNPYAPGNVISGPLFEQFLANLSIDAAAVPSAMPGIDDERALLLDHVFIRKFPMWRFSPKHYLCVDPCFVIDKLAAGFYWAVNKALDTGTATETKKRTYYFSSLWGVLFEDHVNRMLRHAVPPESGRLIENPFYDDPHVEAFDAVVLEDANAIVFQVKGTFARAEGKYSGRFRPFFESLSERFGNSPGGAVWQLASNIRHTFGLPRTRRLPGIPVPEVRVVWPVVVVLEPILDFGLASRLMVERFHHRTRNLMPQSHTSVRPPVFLQIEDLEGIVEHVRAGDYRFSDVLREKLGFDRTHFYSFSNFYWGQFVPERRLTFRRNSIVQSEYADLSERSLTRLAAGEYRSYVVTPFGAVVKR